MTEQFLNSNLFISTVLGETNNYLKKRCTDILNTLKTKHLKCRMTCKFEQKSFVKKNT